MSSTWRKVVSDVWRERGRAAVVVLAITVGLSGFFAVLATRAILGRELNLGYSATNPASAVLVTDAIDEELLASVVARDDVTDADARRTVSGRFQTPDGDWRRLVLFVIRDFQNIRINRITPDSAPVPGSVPGPEWPPATGSMLIERDAFQVAKAGVGDQVTIRTRDGREAGLRVGGAVHDVGQAQARMENMVYGYITPDTLTLFGHQPTLDRLQLIVSGDRFDVVHVRQVANAVKTFLEARGHTVHRVEVPPPGEHPHAGIMGILLLAMAAFGVFTLALSGVIVVNLLLAMMAREKRQIGVMKAIGGTRGQIGRIYLAEAALLGVLSIAVAVPLGTVGSRILTDYFAVLLNFDMTSLAVPAWVYLLVAVVGLIVPLLAAVYPVWTGVAVSVREAVSASGVDAATFGTSRLDRLLCGIGTVGRPWLLGVRNSARRRTRTALTLFTLATGGAFFISALSVRTSMIAETDRMFGAGTAGSIDRYAWDQHMLMIYMLLLIVAGVLASVGGLGLMSAMSLNVLDRRREMGVLRAIGARPAMIGGIVVFEAAFIAVVSWLLAVVVAWPITAGLGKLLTAALFRQGFTAGFSGWGVAGWLGISLTLGLFASLMPAIGASRRSIREAVSYE